MLQSQLQKDKTIVSDRSRYRKSFSGVVQESLTPYTYGLPLKILTEGFNSRALEDRNWHDELLPKKQSVKDVLRIAPQFRMRLKQSF